MIPQQNKIISEVSKYVDDVCKIVLGIDTDLDSYTVSILFKHSINLEHFITELSQDENNEINKKLFDLYKNNLSPFADDFDCSRKMYYQYF